MAFENLTSKFTDAFRKLTSKGKLKEEDINETLRDVKMALLEADVNYKIVKEFISGIKEEIENTKVLESLTPGQNIIKIVNEKLIEMLGSDDAKLEFNTNGEPTIIMLCGLQGNGKTTLAAKLGAKLKQKGKKPLLVACDVYRPAAIDQLEVVSKKANVSFYKNENTKDVSKISLEALNYAKENKLDTVIIDTAGRLHLDEVMMNELVKLKEDIKPKYVLLVVDSMIGQEAVTIAESFNEQLGIDGIVMTKLDSDTRGGAALSIRKITSKPIYYASSGEKIDDLEEFYPKRMASRILGMGDVLTLIDKVQESVNEEEAIKLAEKMKKAEYSFNDFLDQMNQIKKMGPIKDLIKMIPGMGAIKELDNINISEKETKHIEAIIYSMTKEERDNPDILTIQRKRRIASGCGLDISEVNAFIKRFEESRKMMKQLLNNKGMMNKLGSMKGMPNIGGMKFPF
ncbi:MAG: signal recognition particle protein [Clostridia bacterium]|nr:signal recognition particle protein [Clostridia bacterium]